MGFRDRLARFFAGRNGIDPLCYGILVLFVILGILSTAFTNIRAVSIAFRLLQYGVMVWLLFRCFSRNVYARQKENAVFMGFWSKIRDFFVLQKNKFRDRKSFVYKKCPACRATLRLPRRKGNHTVVCPKCKNRFDVRV